MPKKLYRLYNSTFTNPAMQPLLQVLASLFSVRIRSIGQFQIFLADACSQETEQSPKLPARGVMELFRFLEEAVLL